MNGCSTGQEQYKVFGRPGRRRVQYDYRTQAGKLFSCVAKSLAEARQRRDKWLVEQSNSRHMLSTKKPP